MSATPPDRPDPLEFRMEAAFRPGQFVPYGASFAFVRGLETVADDIAALHVTEPARAVALYESFLAGCHEKANEIDDSGGELGGLAARLVCGWIEARQAGGADPDGTATRLLARMDHDPFGFCYRIEKDAARVLDPAGLAAFVRLIRARLDAAGTAPSTDTTAPPQPNPARRLWGETLRTLYLAQRDLAAYLEVAETTGVNAKDCHAAARLVADEGVLAEALAWTDRGLTLTETSDRFSGARFELVRLRRELLVKLGRTREALSEAWTEYERSPSHFTYDDLMTLVPAAERADWHTRAIDAARNAGLHSRLQLLLHVKELDLLTTLVQETSDAALENVSHHATESAAKALEDAQPHAAARLWRAQALRILNARKSKYYAAALDNLRRARTCYERAGQSGDWLRLVGEVRAAHSRKRGFMAEFEELAAGRPPRPTPSFLDRAKARWGGPGSDER